MAREQEGNVASPDLGLTQENVSDGREDTSRLVLLHPSLLAMGHGSILLTPPSISGLWSELEAG